jgi:Na+-transporting NADH:ubiquinone oxidoreductase subunit NqrA
MAMAGEKRMRVNIDIYEDTMALRIFAAAAAAAAFYDGHYDGYYYGHY